MDEGTGDLKSYFIKPQIWYEMDRQEEQPPPAFVHDQLERDRISKKKNVSLLFASGWALRTVQSKLLPNLPGYI